MANVGMPYSDTSAAATSSCVLSGLDAHSATSAPPSLSVSIRLAVSVVTCRHADTRSPLSGFCSANRSRMLRTTGISRAAHSIRRTPPPASDSSATCPRSVLVVVNLSSPNAHCPNDPVPSPFTGQGIPLAAQSIPPSRGKVFPLRPSPFPLHGGRLGWG